MRCALILVLVVSMVPADVHAVATAVEIWSSGLHQYGSEFNVVTDYMNHFDLPLLVRAGLLWNDLAEDWPVPQVLSGALAACSELAADVLEVAGQGVQGVHGYATARWAWRIFPTASPGSPWRWAILFAAVDKIGLEDARQRAYASLREFALTATGLAAALLMTSIKIRSFTAEVQGDVRRTDFIEALPDTTTMAFPSTPTADRSAKPPAYGTSSPFRTPCRGGGGSAKKRAKSSPASPSTSHAFAKEMEMLEETSDRLYGVRVAYSTESQRRIMTIKGVMIKCDRSRAGMLTESGANYATDELELVVD